MSYFSKNYEDLLRELSQLPGVGLKSAGRLAHYIINAPKDQVESLAKSILNAKNNIKKCVKCHSMTDDSLCLVCKDDRRDKKVIMVVENDRDLEAYERIGEYKGVYHVLGGAISPLIGIGPDELNIKDLMIRLREDIKEVIIATNSSIEGETTASYLIKMIKPLGIKVTRIASGVPVGGDIENIDSVTLLRALKGRVEI